MSEHAQDDQSNEGRETLADVVARYMANLSPDEQEERLIERLLGAYPTAVAARARQDSVYRLDDLTAQQAGPAKLAQARAQVTSWAAHLADCEERDRRVAEWQARGPEYADCFCLGRGGAGRQLGLSILGSDGQPVLARVDGLQMWTRERVCTCPDGQAFRAQREVWRQTAREQLRARRVERIAGAAEIPACYRGLTLESWAAVARSVGAEDAHISKILEGVTVWQGLAEQDDSSRKLLLLGGNQGVGKSGLAAALAQEWVDQERGTLYRSVERLATELRAAPWKQRQDPDALPTELQLREALGDAALLVLDDLGAEAMTAGNEQILRELLTGILDRRRTANRPTLVTTNLDGPELHERYGARIYDRLLAPAVAVVVEVAVPNLRWPTA